MPKSLRIIFFLLFPVLAFAQTPKTDSQLTTELENLIPNNTQKLITPANVRTVIQDGWNARIPIYGSNKILGKLTYNSLFPITNDGDLIYKAYLEQRLSEIAIDTTGDTSSTTKVTKWNGRYGDVYLDSLDLVGLAYPRYSNPAGYISSINPATIRAMFSPGTGLGYNTATGQFSLNATTTNVPEGTNQYFTAARVKAIIFGDDPIKFNSTTGHISFAGLSGFGTAGQQIRINSSATGFEYFMPSAGVTTSQALQINGPDVTGTGTIAGGISATIANNAVTTAKINNGAVTVLKIGATGTASGSTWLNGAGIWRGIQFSDISSLPSTLAGYGISDAYPLSGNPSNFVNQAGARAAISSDGPFTQYNSSTGKIIDPYTPENTANKNITDYISTSKTRFPSDYTVKRKIDSLAASIPGSLGYTPENVANKATDFSVINNVKYPTTAAVKNQLDTKQNLIGYTPENVANKNTSNYISNSTTKYPSDHSIYVMKDSLLTLINRTTTTLTATSPLVLGGGTGYCPAVDALGNPLVDGLGNPLVVPCGGGNLSVYYADSSHDGVITAAMYRYILAISSGGGGIGTVTNVSVGSLSGLFTTTSMNTSTTPSFTFALNSQAQNSVFAGPTSGSGTPGFRALVAADIPSITKAKISDFPTAVSSFSNDANYLTTTTGDARYPLATSVYTQTQINNFFSGGTSVTGYNKSQWDQAYTNRLTTGDKGDISINDVATDWQIDPNTIGTNEILDGGVHGADLENVITAGTYNGGNYDVHGRLISPTYTPYITAATDKNIIDSIHVAGSIKKAYGGMLLNNGVPVLNNGVPVGNNIAPFLYSATVTDSSDGDMTSYQKKSLDSLKTAVNVQSVRGTANQIISTGGQNPILSIDPTFRIPYANIDNTPTLFDGDYNNLTNKPTIPVPVTPAGYQYSIQTRKDGAFTGYQDFLYDGSNFALGKTSINSSYKFNVKRDFTGANWLGVFEGNSGGLGIGNGSLMALVNSSTSNNKAEFIFTGPSASIAMGLDIAGQGRSEFFVYDNWNGKPLSVLHSITGRYGLGGFTDRYADAGTTVPSQIAVQSRGNVVTEILRADTTQTADILKLQDYTGADKFKVDVNGIAYVPGLAHTTQKKFLQIDAVTGKLDTIYTAGSGSSAPINLLTGSGGTEPNWSSSSVNNGGTATINIPPAGLGVTSGTLTNTAQDIYGPKTAKDPLTVPLHGSTTSDPALILGNSNFGIFVNGPGNNTGPNYLTFVNDATGTGKSISFSGDNLYATGTVFAGAVTTDNIQPRTLTLTPYSYSANHTVNNQETILLVDATSGPVTITIPSSYAGNMLTVKKIDATSNSVTLDPEGSTQIEFSSTLSLTTRNAAIIARDGTAWYKIN